MKKQTLQTTDNISENKSIPPFSPEKWKSFGQYFEFEKDKISFTDGTSEPYYSYIYYGIIFHYEEDKTLNAEIQYNDYSKKEWKIVNKKLDELMVILDNNGYEYEVMEYSWKIDFTISY
jgi:hypothetical protein